MIAAFTLMTLLALGAAAEEAINAARRTITLRRERRSSWHACRVTVRYPH